MIKKRTFELCILPCIRIFLKRNYPNKYSGVGWCLDVDIPTNIYQGLISKSDAYRSFFLVRWVHSKLENLAKLAENGNIYVKFATR